MERVEVRVSSRKTENVLRTHVDHNDGVAQIDFLHESGLLLLIVIVVTEAQESVQIRLEEAR